MAATGDAHLLRLSREISPASDNDSPLQQRRSYLSAARKARLLSLLFEDLLHHDNNEHESSSLPTSSVLCMKDILVVVVVVVVQRFKALLGDCATRLLLQSDADADAAHFHELSSLLGLLPLPDIVVSDDLLDLVRRQSRRGVSTSPTSLKTEMLDTPRPEASAATADYRCPISLDLMRVPVFVEKLAASPATDVVHELRQLASTTGSENRAFIAEAGAIPLLASEEPPLEVNAVTAAILNLSILDANKKRIMHADGGGATTWRAKDNAAATLLTRRRLGRHPRAVRVQRTPHSPPQSSASPEIGKTSRD